MNGYETTAQFHYPNESLTQWLRLNNRLTSDVASIIDDTNNDAARKSIRPLSVILLNSFISIDSRRLITGSVPDFCCFCHAFGADSRVMLV